jgi:hypothetical protein
MKYQVFAQAYATKYLGEVEANSEDEAYRLAEDQFLDNCFIQNYHGQDYDVSDCKLVVEEN